MSEFLAEAQVLVRPNTVAFRSQLETQLLAATKGIVVPIPVSAVASGAGVAQFAAAQESAAVSSNVLSVSIERQNSLFAEATVLRDRATQAAERDAVAEATAAEQAGLAAVQAERSAAAKAAETKATTLLGTATARLAGIQEAMALTTSPLAAQRVRLAEASGAAAIAERALTQAVLSGVAAKADDAAATLLLARTEEVLARNAAKAAIAQVDETAAARASASSHAFAARGAGAQALAFLGLRGATLAANAAFIAGAAGTILFIKSIKAASDATEQLNKTREVFGTFSKEVEDFAQTSATAFGESRTEALKLVSTFGALLRPIGFSRKAAEEQSIALTKLGADLASFYNTDVSNALEAIQSGLVGQVRPLRRYGAELSAVRVNAEAFRQTGKKLASDLTLQEKTTARISLLFKDTAIAQGDFARTSGELANQTRILTANFANLEAEIGKLAVPIVLGGVKSLNDLAQGLRDVKALIDADIEGWRRLLKLPPATLVVNIVRKFEGGDNKGAIEEQLKTAAIVGGLAALTAAAAATGNVGIATAAGLATLAAAEARLREETGQTTKEYERFVAALKTAGVEVKGSTGVIDATVSSTEELFKSFRTGATSVEVFKLKLAALITVLRTGPAQAQALASALQNILLKIDINPDNIPGADALADALTKAIANAIKPDAITAALVSAGTKAISDASLAVADALGGPGLNLGRLRAAAERQRQTLSQLLGLDPNASVVAILAASAPEELANAVKAGKLTKERADRIAATAAALGSTNSKIESILGTQASDAKAAATKIQTARDKADQAQIEIFTGNRTRLQRLIERAGGTERQGDDIKFTKALIAQLKNQQQEALKRIKGLEARKTFLQATNALIFSLGQSIKKLQSDQAKALKDAAAARKQKASDILDIKIQIAEVNGNIALEKTLLAKKIAQIKAQIKSAKGQALLQAQLRLQLAETQKQLQELTGAKKKNIKAESEFSFLQAQQGFAANLFGNLIPGGATGGLVGNVTAAPGAGVTGAAAVAQGKALTTPTSGGQNATNQLLNQILEQLKKLNSGEQAPEATRQRKVGTAAGDGAGGGSLDAAVM